MADHPWLPVYRCEHCGEHTRAVGFGKLCIPCWSLLDAEKMGK